MAKYEFYKHFGCDPFQNMAVDEWLFARAAENPGSILLRAYTWSEGAVTYGFNQKQEVAFDHTRLGQTKVIRRITGGRALYHDPSELTYAIAINIPGADSHLWAKSIKQSSGVIAETLVAFLAEVGIESEYARQSSKASGSQVDRLKPACFESVARHEIVGNTGKIVASAQRRIGSTIFQHGAIKLNGVVPHPSLELKNENQLQPLSTLALCETTFHALADALSAQFSRQSRVNLVERSCSNVDWKDIQARKEWLKKNNHSRRDIFERNRPTISL